MTPSIFWVLFASLSSRWAFAAGRLLGPNGKYASSVFQGRIAVTNSEKRCVDAFSQKVDKIYESSKVEGFKLEIRRHLEFLSYAVADDLFLLYPAVTNQRWRCILDKTASALEFPCDQFQNIPVFSLNCFDEFKFFSLKRLKMDGFLHEKSKNFLSGDPPK